MEGHCLHYPSPPLFQGRSRPHFPSSQRHRVCDNSFFVGLAQWHPATIAKHGALLTLL